ncbi:MULTISPECIES: hypothetical protein [unclassified Streptomyces]|uniref:hypothetical protein n=1 Tax=unclassified Streptomyces TaxID=2593676 RepID=UPI0035D66DD6
MAEDHRATKGVPDPVGDMRRRGKKLNRGFGGLGVLLVLGGIVGPVRTGAAPLTSMPLFGCPGLIAIGVGGRRIVSRVTPPEPVSGPAPEPLRESSAEPFPESSESARDQSNN